MLMEILHVQYNINETDSLVIMKVSFDPVPAAGSAIKFGDALLHVDMVVHVVPSNFVVVYDDDGKITKREEKSAFRDRQTSVVKIICNKLTDLQGKKPTSFEKFARNIRDEYEVLMPQELEDFLNLTYGTLPPDKLDIELASGPAAATGYKQAKIKQAKAKSVNAQHPPVSGWSLGSDESPSYQKTKAID